MYEVIQYNKMSTDKAKSSSTITPAGDAPAAAKSFPEEESGRRNDLIMADGFPALNTFKPPTGKSTGDDDYSPTKDDPIPRYPFASFPSSLKVQSAFRQKFLSDCERAFTARDKEDGAAYSAGATFFVPAQMTPRCALEELALDIFKAHTKGLKEGEHYDPERSGAEWWTLVLESGDNNAAAAKKGNDEDSDEDEEDDEVGMHFDADYGLEAQLPNYMLHPRVATITYLSDCGVPTLILDKVSPPPNDASKKSLNGDVSTGWISHPQFGKHVAFDGRLLHGAPGTFFPAQVREGANSTDSKRRKLDYRPDYLGGGLAQTDPTPGKRVTFLVNIWLNHCPIDAEILDAEEAYAMEIPFKDNDWRNQIGLITGSRPIEFKIPNVDKPEKVPCMDLEVGEEGAGIDECVLCNHEVDMKFEAPMEMCHYASSTAASSNDGGSMQIRFKPGALSLVVGKEVEDSDDDG